MRIARGFDVPSMGDLERQAPRDRIKKMLTMSDRMLEDLCARITYTEDLSPELGDCITQVCIDMHIPGGCFPEKAGSVKQGTAVAGMSDTDIWVRSPGHNFTRKERMEFARNLALKARDLGLIENIYHVGRKSIKLSIANGAPIDVVLVNIKHDAGLEEVDFPDIKNERLEIAQFFDGNLMAQNVVKLLKFAFQGTKKVRGSSLEKAVWRVGLGCNGLNVALQNALGMIRYWRTSLVILRILADDMRRIKDEDKRKAIELFGTFSRLEAMAAQVSHRKRGTTLEAKKSEKSHRKSRVDDFLSGISRGRNLPPHRDSSPEYRDIPKEPQIFAGRMLYINVASDATPIWYWK